MRKDKRNENRKVWKIESKNIDWVRFSSTRMWDGWWSYTEALPRYVRNPIIAGYCRSGFRSFSINLWVKVSDENFIDP